VATVPSFQPGTALQQSDLLFLLTPPQGFVYQQTAQTFTTGVGAAVLWDTLGYDTDPTMWSSGTRLTLNTPGKWLIISSVVWVANATGPRQLDLRKNAGGSPTGGSRLVIDIRQATSSGAVSNTCAVMQSGFVAGDYIEAFASQTSGGNLNTLSTAGVGAVGLWARWIGV